MIIWTIISFFIMLFMVPSIDAIGLSRHLDDPFLFKTLCVLGSPIAVPILLIGYLGYLCYLIGDYVFIDEEIDNKEHF